MQEYLIPIKTAFFIFPFIAFFITIPYMLIQYRKFGSIPVLRTIIVYSFILYLINAYFLVILPLPPIDEVVEYTSPTTQLIPFQFISDMLEKSKFVWSKPSTYIEIITNPVIYQVFYNILMILPFGFYLRYYFKKNLLETIGFSFILSLFFELTQLTGLYGIYPRGYRLFDVDDLMINTFGGMIGYIITPLIAWMLPSKEKLDEISYERGKQISYTRRLIAFVLDNIMVLLLALFLEGALTILSVNTLLKIIGLPICYVGSIVVYFMILLPIMDGISIGKRIVKLKIVSDNGETAKWWQYVVRYGILYIIVLPAPIIILTFMKEVRITYPTLQFILFGVSSLLIILYFSLFFQIFLSLFHKRKILYYETLSHTKNISTIEEMTKKEVIESKLTNTDGKLDMDEETKDDELVS